MYRLWSLCRFFGSVAAYYVNPTPPDFQVEQAECDGQDATADLLARLAVLYCQPDVSTVWSDSKRLLVRYKYRGAGPFVVYFDAKEKLEFPPLSKLDEPSKDASGQPLGIVKGVDSCVVSAEIMRSVPDSEEKTMAADVSSIADMLAGPDGKWHKRLDVEAKSWGTLDPLVVYPSMLKGDALVLSFASGEEIELIYDL